jgi:hypothetical protein
MMNVKKIIPAKRRLTFLLTITLVIAIFFIGYNFYYIPGNQNIVNKNAFLILENISRNIKERNEYLQAAFGNILKPNQEKSTSKNIDAKQQQKQLNLYVPDGKILSGKNINTTDSVPFSDGHAVYLDGIYNDSLLYRSEDIKNVNSVIYIPSQNFIAPSIASQKKELFESYALLHSKAGLVYADEGLGIDKGIAADSLIADKKEALFAAIKEIKIKGVAYKMFYYPFRLGKENVQLCGFLKQENYYKKSHQMPVAFIYPIIIILVLLLIMMPLVKYYLMGKDEQVTFTDFLLAVTSLFTGSAIITIIIIQVLLLMAADIRLRKNLTNISAQIENSFTNEIKQAYLQLTSLDSVIKTNPLTGELYRIEHSDQYDVSDIMKRYFQDHSTDTTLYYNFNRVSWIDEQGNQELKGQTDTGRPVFTNVAARDYFKIFNHSAGYPVPGLENARFGFEPVNSLTNGDFSIIISEKNRIGPGWTTTISCPMYSVLNTILPPGYGFCITDENGRVLLHSETNRSLQENILENADPSRPLAEAIKSRQELFCSGINLYSRNNAVNIKPVEGLPLHLLTFYDKGYIVPVNMRILSFSLVFCAVSFAICLMMWVGFRKRRKKFTTNLYGPLYKLKWLLPKQCNLEFYILGKYFLLVNLLLHVAVIFFFKQLGISNYAVLVLTVIMPIHLYIGLFVINYRVRKDMPIDDVRHSLPSSKKIISNIILQLLIGLAVWFSSRSAYPIETAFLYFIIFFNIFLWILYLLPAGTFGFIQNSSKKYLNQYALYATLLILSITAWPASLYTWYAHNQEITQSVKKGQLYLADALRQRADQGQINYSKLLALHPPPGYINKLQLHAGIYTIYNDEVTVTEDKVHAKDKDAVYEKFYFSIANEIGNNYYDPLMIPVLKDNAADDVWHWSKDLSGTGNRNVRLSFTYHLYDHPYVSGDKIARNTEKALAITSTFPDRYIFIKPSKSSVLLGLIVAAIIFGLYRLLRYICYHLFLIKFINGTPQDAASTNSKLEKLFSNFKKNQEDKGKAVNITAAEVTQLKDEYSLYKTLSGPSAEYGLEKTMFATQQKYKSFFDFIWNNLSIKEKFLLLNYAQNSFVNFKNTEVIHRLLEDGILIVQHEEVRIFSVSFRAYVLQQKNSEEMLKVKTELRQQSAWQSFRVPLLIIILGVALFIFTTQEQTFEKITALLTGVTTVFTLLMKFFTDGSNIFSSKKTG